MTAHVVPNQIHQLRSYAVKLLDLVWDAAVVVTFGFALIVTLLFAIGLAVDLNIMQVPPQLCHYMSGNQHMDDFCK